MSKNNESSADIAKKILPRLVNKNIGELDCTIMTVEKINVKLPIAKKLLKNLLYSLISLRS